MLFLLKISQNEAHFKYLRVGNQKTCQFSDAFGTRITADTNFAKQTRTGNSNQYSPSGTNVAVEDCVFHDITSESNGGAISCTSITKIFIETTTFTTCKTTNLYGGGIYFSNYGSGECVISHTCGFNCSSQYSGSSNTYGQYAYIKTKKDPSSKNEVNETTITGSKKESEESYYALSLVYSNIICSSVNITNNECRYYTALYCCPTDKTSALTCFIMYTSIVNNSAKSGYGCIWLSNEDSRQLISTSNIINNKQDDDKTTEATINAYANIFINESCIIGNNEDNNVFYVNNAKCQIQITNCTLDSDIMTSKRYSGSVTVVISKEYSYINILTHIVTEKCESFYDYIRYLNFEKTIKSPKCIISCKRRPRQTNDVFLAFLQYLCIISLLPSLSSKSDDPQISKLNMGFQLDPQGVRGSFWGST